MCKPKVPKPEKEERPDVLTTARDGQPIQSAAKARTRSGLRLDLNNPTLYQGLTIPRG